MTATENNNRWLPVAFAVTLLTAPWGQAATAQVRAITLEEAVTLALRNNPTVIQARGDLRIAGASRREAVGDWLPNLSSNGGWSRNSSQRFDQATQRTVSGGATSYSAGLSASYTLFDGFRRNANGKAANADLESADANLVSQEFQVALQTKQAFFNAVAGQELVRVSETRIERAARQLQITREQLAAGAAIRSDTLRSFVELSNARLQLLNAQTQRETATANLARLVGLDVEIEAVGDSLTITADDMNIDALQREALEHSPLLLQSVAQARAADAQVTVSRAQYFPSLSTSYSQSWAGQQLDALNSSWTLRLSVSFPIFNGFTREAGVVRARAQQDVARARVEDVRRQIDADLTQYFASLESSRVRLQIAEASRAAATEDLRVQQERYRLGVSTIVEVLASQVNLDQAEVDIVQARLDYLVAKAQLEALIGREI